MKGNNVLIMNEATLREALQEYLKKRWEPQSGESVPEVVGVSQKDSHLGTFEVKLLSGMDTPGPVKA